MDNTEKTQQTIEQQLEKFSQQAVSEDKTMLEVFGPIENWTLELGSQTLFLDPLEKAWYYLEPLHQSWERTGFGPGEAQFVAVGNKLGVRHFEEADEQPEPEEAETMLRQKVYFLLEVQAPEFATPVPVAGDLTAGRGYENDIVLKDRLASRNHAIFHWDGKSLSIEDLGATNGTRVNDAEIYELTALKPGDVIEIGETSIRVVRAGEEAAS